MPEKVKQYNVLVLFIFQSATQYFVGEFDGETFTTNQKDIKWLDLGADNYAGITYNNVPNNERIFRPFTSKFALVQHLKGKPVVHGFNYLYIAWMPA